MCGIPPCIGVGEACLPAVGNFCAAGEDEIGFAERHGGEEEEGEGARGVEDGYVLWMQIWLGSDVERVGGAYHGGKCAHRYAE